MSKMIDADAEKTRLVTTSQDVIVAVKPKYFVPSTGSVWGSHLIENRHNYVVNHEVSVNTQMSAEMKGNIIRLKDVCSSFNVQTTEEDLQMCCREYEQDKLAFLKSNLDEISIELEPLNNLIKGVKDDADLCESVLGNPNSTDKDVFEHVMKLVRSNQDVLNEVDSCGIYTRPRVVDLTDAGPGVGINNHEVYMRMVQEILICSYDYYARIHLGPGDSAMNEVERIQSSVGDAICDGGYISWEKKDKFDGLTDDEILKLSSDDIKQMELERMEFNARSVCQEVASRIDGAESYEGYMKAFVSNPVHDLFFWDVKYLKQFLSSSLTGRKSCPGYFFYTFIREFMDSHCRVAEKSFEYVKLSCSRECVSCKDMRWFGPEVKSIPEPFPDSSNPGHYRNYVETPTHIDGIERLVDDYNPRVQFKQYLAEGLLKLDDEESIQEFSEKYLVSDDMVRISLQEARNKTLTNTVREQDRKKMRDEEKSKNWNAYNWKELIESGSIKKMVVSSLDKYLKHHNLEHVLALPKGLKIESIIRHFYNQIPAEEISESDNDNDDDDQVLCATNEDY